MQNNFLLEIAKFQTANQMDGSNGWDIGIYRSISWDYNTIKSLLDYLNELNHKVFVRHPLDRIVSAYVDKVLSTKAKDYAYVRKGLVQKYGQVTFQNFLS